MNKKNRVPFIAFLQWRQMADKPSWLLFLFKEKQGKY